MQKKHHLSQLRNDISLLVPLYYLLKNKRLDHVANELCVGQSAVSHHLARLREIFDDRLLVRTAHEMKITPFGEQLLPDVEELLSGLDVLLSRRGGQVEPPRRTYRICLPESLCPDSLFSLCVTPPGSRPQSRAVALEIRFSHENSMNDLLEGKTDLLVDPVAKSLRQICTSPLPAQVYVMAARRGHPLTGHKIRGHELQHYPLAELVSGGHHHRTALTDGMRTILSTTSAGTLVRLLSCTDTLCLLPESVVHQAGLATLSFPGASVAVPHSLFWHQSASDDPLHRLIRESFCGQRSRRALPEESQVAEANR